MAKITSQNYPRITDEKDKFHGFLDESKLVPHNRVITEEEIQDIIKNAIIEANKKSSRAILNIPSDADKVALSKLLKKEGHELFKYFVKYCGDPASTANDCYNKHFTVVAKEQFRNRTLQKERMNSGWRYQFIAKDAAIVSKRFVSVSDIGTNEADFNAILNIKERQEKLNIYVSVKNRTNTMGGQDWPKAIRAIEDMANADRNKTGPFICVFGIAMDKGLRLIKCDAKSKRPHSYNTEVWLSDFFWPFFSTMKYEQIVKNVLNVLLEIGEGSSLGFDIPDELIKSFGESCSKLNLLDKDGNFNDPYLLVELFCGKLHNESKRSK